MWKISEQVVEDLVTGLRFEFRTSGGGHPMLVVTRFDEGVAGIAHRDIVFDADGGMHGSAGSGLGGCGLPINPPQEDADPADHWKG